MKQPVSIVWWISLLCFFGIGMIALIPVSVFTSTCACEVDYYHYQGCSRDNINFPFTATIEFSAENNGLSVWDVMRQYLRQGYPAVCDDTSSLMRTFFLRELEQRVELTCRTTAETPPLRRDICYVVTGYNRNEPIIATRQTVADQDLPDESCVKSDRGDILRGCSSSVPPSLIYDRSNALSYVGDHNTCSMNLADRASAYEISYSVSCTQTSADAVVTTTPPVAASTSTKAYSPIDYVIPSTQALRRSSATNLPAMIGSGLRLFTGIFGSIALVMIVYGGLTMMTARGQGDKMKEGANIVLWASIGLITMMLSYVLVLFVFGAIL